MEKIDDPAFRGWAWPCQSLPRFRAFGKGKRQQTARIVCSPNAEKTGCMIRLPDGCCRRTPSAYRKSGRKEEGTAGWKRPDGTGEKPQTAGNGRQEKTEKQAKRLPKRKRGLGEAAYGVFDRFRFPKKPSIKSPYIYSSPDSSLFTSLFLPCFRKNSKAIFLAFPGRGKRFGRRERKRRTGDFLPCPFPKTPGNFPFSNTFHKFLSYR